jgi:polyhydroxyalkanoate synthase
MTQDQELTELMQSITQKSMRLIEQIQQDPRHFTNLLSKFIEISENLQKLMLALLNNPEKLIQMQLSYWESALATTKTLFEQWSLGIQPPINDKRFGNELWQTNPFYQLLSSHYLLACQKMNELLEQITFEDKNSAKRIKFFSQQFLDALSPTNYIHTNPQILCETIESRGKNLLSGLLNLLTDIEEGKAHFSINMTDSTEFVLGKNLATTPGAVVFRNEMMELIQYTATTPKVHHLPLLVIPPWINKYYILDLSPHNSLIQWLVAQGITVFAISWVNPQQQHAHKGLYDYLHEGPITALEIIQKKLQVKTINTLGFCIGGTLLALLLAYQKAHNQHSIQSATFLATLIDFSQPGDIEIFIDEQQIQKIEQEMSDKGYLPGDFMAASFNSLRANDLVWSFFINNYLQGKKPVPFDILHWNSDTTNMPQTMHSQYLRWMYLENNLIKPKKITLNKTPIDLSNITTPTFFLATQKDHIAPWTSVYKGFSLMKGPKCFALGGSGHIAGIINAPASKKYGYYTNIGAPESADEWKANALQHEGSWWPYWFEWLKKQSGATHKPYMVEGTLCSAPGTYVRAMSTTP